MSYRVLVADDHAGTQEVLKEYLRLTGYEVLIANDGREALALAAARQPDLVLLDVQMPGMDGFVTLQELRRLPGHDETPVIFLTGLDRGYLKVKGLELGADDYVTKPYDRAELLARIKVALRRSARFRTSMASLQGRLADVRLAHLLQTLDIGSKTAQVSLPELEAEVVVGAGQFVAARWREHSGEAALTRILLLEAGTFTVRFDTTRQGGEAVSLTTALLRCVTTVDEVRDGLYALGGTGARVTAAGVLDPWPALDAARPLLPMRLDLLVATLPDTLGENLATVKAAVAAGALRASSEGGD